MPCASRLYDGMVIAPHIVTSFFRFCRIHWAWGPRYGGCWQKCHDVRNSGEYEGDLNVDERLVTDLVTACRAVADKVEQLGPLPEK